MLHLLILSLISLGSNAQQTMWEIIQEPKYAIFREWVELAGLASALNDTTVNETLIAPLNSSFASENQTLLGIIKNDTNLVRQVVLYHILPTRQVGAQIPPNSILVTKNPNNNLTTNSGFQRGTIDALRSALGLFQVPEVPGSNGIVIPINRLMLPILSQPTTTSGPVTSTTTGTTTTSGPITSTTSGPITSTTTRITTTSSGITPEDNARAIAELQLRVTALERAIAACNCGSHGGGGGGGYKGSRVFGSRRYYGYGNRRYNNKGKNRWGW